MSLIIIWGKLGSSMPDCMAVHLVFSNLSPDRMQTFMSALLNKLMLSLTLSYSWSSNEQNPKSENPLLRICDYLRLVLLVWNSLNY